MSLTRGNHDVISDTVVHVANVDWYLSHVTYVWFCNDKKQEKHDETVLKPNPEPCMGFQAGAYTIFLGIVT